MHSQSSELQPPSTSRASSVAQLAVDALGRGYDVTCDLWLSYCKNGERLIENDTSASTQDLYLPGNIIIPNVSTSVKCDKGDRTRFTTDVLTFNEMSEQFNQSLAISGKIPLGHFNAMFNLSGSWQKDASSVKTLAMYGVFINLYSVELPRTQLTLKEEVRAAVPTSWDPAALASFVEKYGTHVIVGVKIGGKDVICIKQHSSSSRSAVGVQKILEAKSKERFSSVEGNTSKEKINKGKIRDGSTIGSNGVNAVNPYRDGQKSGVPLPWINDSSTECSTIETDEVTVIFKRKGGRDSSQSHDEWLQTVPSAPDIVSMSFVPITSLLNGVAGSGFLSHAINLYLRYKPTIQELHHFLEFQLPKEWAPAYGDLPLGPPRKQQGSPSLQFRLLGPKLQVNTTPVVVGKRCITGVRLHLEGKKGNRLALHLQYLTVVPQILQHKWEDDQPELWEGPDTDFSRYFEPVMWKSFSHVCTAPVEGNEIWEDDSKDEQGGPKGALIVTGAQLNVEQHGSKKVLFLKLLYSKIQGASIRRSEWDHSASQQKSGIFSTLMSTTFSSAQDTPIKPVQVVVNSAIYPQGPPPANSQAPKLLKFVETTEMTRGPVDFPGHWLVTGAKLFLNRGKIAAYCQDCGTSIKMYSTLNRCL